MMRTEDEKQRRKAQGTGRKAKRRGLRADDRAQMTEGKILLSNDDITQERKISTTF